MRALLLVVVVVAKVATSALTVIHPTAALDMLLVQCFYVHHGCKSEENRKGRTRFE